MQTSPATSAHPPMPPIHVDRDGCWAWEGQPMLHEGILLYLKQHLARDADGSYWVTVGEARVPVIVEDAPFVVEALLAGPPRALLDDGREIPLSDPLRVLTSRENRLYVPVHDDRDRALLSRKAHHQVWEALDEDPGGRLWLAVGSSRVGVMLAALCGPNVYK